jgi:hypothetical protein
MEVEKQSEGSDLSGSMEDFGNVFKEKGNTNSGNTLECHTRLISLSGNAADEIQTYKVVQLNESTMKNPAVKLVPSHSIVILITELKCQRMKQMNCIFGMLRLCTLKKKGILLQK